MPRATQEFSAAQVGSAKWLAKDIMQSRSLTDMEVAFCTTPESNNNDWSNDNVSFVSDLDDNFSNTSGSHYYNGGNDYGVCSTVNEIREKSIAKVAQSFVALIIAVVKILFQIFTTVIRAIVCSYICHSFMEENDSFITKDWTVRHKPHGVICEAHA